MDCCYTTMLLLAAAFMALRWAKAKFYHGPRIESRDLASKAVLVTGCDTGFGRMIVRQLAKKYPGMKVLAGCLTDQGIADLKSAKGVHAFNLDVTSQASVDALPDVIRKQVPGGKLWAVVNNAGLIRTAMLEATTAADWRIQFEVNVLGMAQVTRACIPFMRYNKGSRFVNVASVAGRLSYPGCSAYCASKFGVEALSDALRREMHGWGIKVVVLEPGIMKTNLWDPVVAKNQADRSWEALTEEQQEAYGREFMDASLEGGIKLINKVAGDPQQVVDVMDAAVTCVNPCDRYRVGSDTIMYVVLSYLPSAVSDFIMRLDKIGKPVPAGMKK